MQNLPFDNMLYSGVPPPFYPNFPIPQPNPIVIGEGEVSAVIGADGSLQYFFQPTVARWPVDVNAFSTCRTCCPCTCSSPKTAVWFIKSINPGFRIQPMFNPTLQRPDVPLLMRQSFNFESIEKPLELKFHNDGCTSTTDLHYFFPTLRCREWIPKVGAQVQVEIPTERDIFHYVIPVEPRKEECKMETEEEPSGIACKCSNKVEKSVVTFREQGSSQSYDNHTQTQKKRAKKKKSTHDLCTCGSDCSSGRFCGCHSDSS